MPENRTSVDAIAVIRLAQQFSAAVSQEAYDALQEPLDYKLGTPSKLPSVNKEDDKPTKSAELCAY